ncbi:MAG: autotransporter outer membrane beta-barrel domain-containing protein [Opitutaceae bacterium]|jgi:outer membrane autotransporter protein|nr:autotransporter outer membrane beta-barrel domain-containing protein [Opitutaceae bacterium]
MHTPKYLTLAATLIASAAALAPSVLAQNRYWTGNNGNSNWHEAGNWSPSMPAAGNNVYIDSGSYGTNPTPILNTGSVSLGGVSVGTDTGGGALTITGTAILANTGASRIGRGAGADGRVTVSGSAFWRMDSSLSVGENAGGMLDISESGSVAVGTTLNIGRYAAATGSGTVKVGGSASLSVGTNMTVGEAGAGTLSVEGIASVTVTNNVVIGSATGATGTATISGTGWLNVVTGTLTVGASGAGALVIKDSGTVTNAGAAIIASATSSTGGVTVGDNARWTSTGQITVGSRGAASLTIEDNAVVKSLSNVYIAEWTTSQSTLTLTGGASLEAGGDIRVGMRGTGSLTLSGSAAASGNQAYIGYTDVALGGVVVSGSARWDTTGLMSIGSSGTGMLTLENEAVATAGSIVFAGAAGALGTATVGGTATLSTSGSLVVGALGSGTLAIKDSGTVVSGAAIITATTGASGFVSVSDDARWRINGDLDVALRDSGTLEIGDTARVAVTGSAFFGHNAASAGVVTVGGTSSLEVDGALAVGASGTGTLTIEKSGTVISGSASIAAGTGASGFVSVGNDAGWQINGDLDVGNRGSGTLAIDGGGRVAATGSVSIGLGNAAGAGALLVGGSAFFSGGDDLLLGAYADSRGTLEISESGTVVTAGLATIGYSSRAVGEVTVSGSALWRAGNLRVGGQGPGTLVISDSAAVGSDGYVYIAHNTNAQGSISIGDDARMTATGDLRVGQGNSSSGTLTIADRATVTSNRAYIAYGGTSSGVVSIGDAARWETTGSFTIGYGVGGSGEVTVSETATLSVGGVLTVGASGTGNLTISDHATVSSGPAIITATTGAAGFASIGNEAGWQINGDLEVGLRAGGTLEIDGVARVAVTGSAFLGRNGTGDGVVTVGGTSSFAVDGMLTVGTTGTGTLAIGNSGTVVSGAAGIAAGTGASGFVSVGNDAGWQINGDLQVGNRSSGTLAIDGGGRVAASGAVSIGLGSAAGHGTLLVGGSAFFSGGGDLLLGANSDSRGSLEISESGTVVTAGLATIGYQQRAVGEVTVSGSALWQAGNLRVGGQGPGTLVISDSATVGSDGHVYVANNTNSQGVISIGDDARMTAAGDLRVGSGATSSGTLTIADRATVTSGNSHIAYGGTSSGVVTIGDAARWDIAGQLTVGYSGTGVLVVGDAAVVTSASTVLAYGATGHGTLVLKGGGVLETGAIQRRSTAGTAGAAVELNGGVIRATAASADFFAGIGDIAINAAGVAPGASAFVFDTNGFEITATNSFNYNGPNAGVALEKTGAGTLTLAAANGYNGATRVTAGVLNAGAPGAIVNSSGVTVAPGAALDLGGFTQVLKKLENNGEVRFGTTAATVGRTLTLLGGLSGTGAYAMSVDFARRVADSITVTGPATGSHVLQLKNLGGAAPPDAGLALLELAGGGDAEFTANDVDGGMGSYALAPAIDPVTGAVTYGLVATGGPSRAAGAILGTAGSLGAEWHHSLDSLRGRLGEIRAMKKPGKAAAGTWYRASAYHLDADVGLTGLPFDQDTYGVAAGLDRALPSAASQLVLGAFFTVNRTDRHYDNHGEGDTKDYGGGLYLAWLHESGWFADLVLKGDQYKNSFAVLADDGAATGARYASAAAGFSVEFGRKVPLGRFWLEPAAQIATAWLGGGGYDTSTGIRVEIDRSSAAQYRGQVRLGVDAGPRWRPHARLGAVRGENSGGLVRTAEGSWATQFAGWRFEAGAGCAVNVEPGGQLYLDYEYNKAAHYERPWAVSLGYRRMW